MPNAVIFGCGPAGLLAALACAMEGYKVQIFSRRQKSPIYGAQFIGENVGPFEIPSTMLRVMMVGTEDGYRKKVYGPDFDGPVSPSEFLGEHNVFDLRTMYDRLWDMFSGFVVDAAFTAKTFAPAARALREGVDFVFSSIPLDRICVDSTHEFSSQEIYAAGDAPDRGIECPVRIPEDQIIYSGNDFSGWYRAANIFGHCTAEWPAKEGDRKPPFSNVVRVRKPLSTNCTCHPGVIRVGRYGTWSKGVLSIDAFYAARSALQQKGVQNALFS